jgi:hypothetical protein
MSFTPEDYVRLFSPNDVEDICQDVGRYVSVTLDEPEIFAAPHGEYGAKRSRLSLILVEVHEPEVFRGECRQPVFAGSRTFIGNHKNFVREARL